MMNIKYRCPKCKITNSDGKKNVIESAFGNVFCWNCGEYTYKNPNIISRRKTNKITTLIERK